MQTYKFDELTDRAKQRVRMLYLADIIKSWPKIVGTEIMEALRIVDGWRFNEHGERIA